MFPAIRETIERMNGENLLYDAKSLEEVVGDSMAARRFTMVLLAFSPDWHFSCQALAYTV